MGATFDHKLKQMLRKAGCTFIRQAKGSHELWYSPISKRHFVVPTGIVIRHTTNAILKEAGLAKAL